MIKKKIKSKKVKKENPKAVFNSFRKADRAVVKKHRLMGR